MRLLMLASTLLVACGNHTSASESTTSESITTASESITTTEARQTVFFAGQQLPVDTEVIDLVNVSIVTLSPLVDLPNLRVLRIRNTNPHRSGGGMPLDLAALAQCQHLTVLELPGHNIRSLEGVEWLPNLRTLDLSSSRVEDIAPLARLPALTSLKLRHTRLANIDSLASVATLQHLDIAHTRVPDITALRGLTALQTLDLRATLVDDLSALHQMSSLTQVVVQRLSVAPEAIESLRDARPELEIVD